MRRPLVVALTIALAAGGALRFWRLSEVPVALYCDEAFQGYEAYSLVETGADSRGVRTPLFFDIFGVGWEEPLYVYLTTIPVKILGTTEAATRAVAAAAGTLSLAAVAALAFPLGGEIGAAAAALAMAVSPWAFHFSRTGFQASLLPLFLAAGAAALLHGSGDAAAGRRPRFGVLLAGASLLALALYTYVAARFLVPLLLAGIAVAAIPSLRTIGAGRAAAIAAVVVVIAAPVAIFALTPQGQARYQDVSLASRFPGGEAAWRFAANYASYFTPEFLLTRGDPNARHSIPGFGALHAHDLLLLCAGAVAAMRRRGAADLFVLWWLAIAPLPAALAADPAHAVRAIGAIPPIYALEGLGAFALLRPGRPLDPARRRSRALLAAVALAALVSSAAYLRSYFVDYPRVSGPAWEYGLKEAYREIEAVGADHDSFYVTRTIDFPFIQRLYLFAFPPAEYQRSRFAGTKYLFDEPVFYGGGLVPGRLSPLFLLKPDEVPEQGIAVRRTIRYPDGSAAFVLAW
ncbi:MAG: hypothetical protein HY049_03940 [Acidobacteria bacterium]|nr:hypothetical protein [Acidobacteriota bacterium]